MSAKSAVSSSHIKVDDVEMTSEAGETGGGTKGIDASIVQQGSRPMTDSQTVKKPDTNIDPPNFGDKHHFPKMYYPTSELISGKDHLHPNRVYIPKIIGNGQFGTGQDQCGVNYNDLDTVNDGYEAEINPAKTLSMVPVIIQSTRKWHAATTGDTAVEKLIDQKKGVQLLRPTKKKYIFEICETDHSAATDAPTGSDESGSVIGFDTMWMSDLAGKGILNEAEAIIARLIISNF